MNKPVLPMSSLSLKLPTADRSIETYRLAASRTFPAKLEGTLNRGAFSAAPVVADPLADTDPWLSSAIDWDRTIAFREHVWDLGLGVAEAMDTAQRGMGLDWPTSLELVQRSVKAAKARGNALVFSGAGTDHLAVDCFLDGITRQAVIGLARSRGIEVIERHIKPEELDTAAEVFLTGTAVEVTPIRDVDGHAVGDGFPGPITTRIQQAYFDVVYGRDPRYRHWLSFAV